MGTKDPRVDAYIEAAAPFAQPVLAHLRAAVHAACPGTTEAIKWGMPFFMHGTRILAYMAAFKQHCGFGFWRSGDAVDRGKEGQAMGQFGRITCKADLPAARELQALVRAVVAQMDATAADAPPASAKANAKSQGKSQRQS